MCSKIYRDKKGTQSFERIVTCNTIPNIIEPKLDSTIEVIFNEDNFNARLESIQNTWKIRGMIWVQTQDKIESFLENNKLKIMSDELDVYTIATPNRDDHSIMELRIITRYDGLTYFNKRGKYPPFITAEIARFENRTHSRWPLYRKRIPQEII